jgi:hypothetical protein
VWGSVVVVWGRVEAFERDRAVHSDAGVSPFRIVPAFYPLEDGVGKFVSCLPLLAVEKFELHGAPERLRGDPSGAREHFGGSVGAFITWLDGY